ncbi:MAG: hypothetical protein JSW55_17430 [Chloroflexota bacterium]|nr:MAG: hypothetical protein JSW55_17430 [Chloroflexota bacterium]
MTNMVDEKVFVSVDGRNLNRASRAQDGSWSVETYLGDQKACCLAADPSKKDVIYVGTNGNGVFRSEDRGRMWSPVGLAGQIVKSLAVSPQDSNIIYAGMKPATVAISGDGGQTWAELESFRRIRGRRFWFSPAEPPDKRAYVQAIAISPTNPEVIMAGIEFGAVVRSEDGGQTWSNHVKGTLRDCHDLKFHAASGDWVYESGGGGAAVGRENGRAWRKANATLGLTKRYGAACAADPERPEVWYISAAFSPGKAYGETAETYLFRSSAGAGWQPIGWQEHPLPQLPIALVTDPAAPGHLYAGLTYGDVWHSTDYGDKWQKLPFSLGRIWRSMIIM